MKLSDDPRIALIQIGGYLDGYCTIAEISGATMTRTIPLLRSLQREAERISEKSIDQFSSAE